MRELPFDLRFPMGGQRVRLVHGSSRRVNEYLFEDKPASLYERLAATAECDVLVFDHTHKPWIHEYDRVQFVTAARWESRRTATPRGLRAPRARGRHGREDVTSLLWTGLFVPSQRYVGRARRSSGVKDRARRSTPRAYAGHSGRQPNYKQPPPAAITFLSSLLQYPHKISCSEPACRHDVRGSAAAIVPLSASASDGPATSRS
jgi:hypothetical protein